MHWHVETVVLAILLCVAVYSLLTKVIARTVVTLPINFMSVGYLVSHQVNTLADPEALTAGTRLLAVITLIHVLFSDARHVRFQQLKKSYKIPARMLVIGLPLTLAFGTLITFMINPQSGVAMALLTAAVLTPTDAVIGQTVVSSPDVLERLRQSVHVESGLNDGLVLPFVLVGAMLTANGSGDVHTAGFAWSVILQIVLGPFVGILCGWGLARAMDFAQTRNLMAEPAAGVVFYLRRSSHMSGLRSSAAICVGPCPPFRSSTGPNGPCTF